MAGTSWMECLYHFVNKLEFYWKSTQRRLMLVSLVLVGVNESMMECYVCLTMCYSALKYNIGPHALINVVLMIKECFPISF